MSEPVADRLTLHELLWRIDEELDRMGWGIPPILALLIVDVSTRRVRLRAVPGFDMACGFHGDAVQAVGTLRGVFETAPPDIKRDWFDGKMGDSVGALFTCEAHMLGHEDADGVDTIEEIAGHPNSVQVRMTTLVDRDCKSHVLVHERDGGARISAPDEWFRGELIADLTGLVAAIV